MRIGGLYGWLGIAASLCLVVACDGDETTSTSSTSGTGGMGTGGGTGGMGTGGGTGGTGTGGGTGGTGGGVPTVSSCDGLASDCGPSANEDCCASPTVVGGTYNRSYDGILDTDNSNPATVSTFALDRFEVTVGRFRAFVNAGMGTQASPPSEGAGAHPLITGSGWDAGWNSSLQATTGALQTTLKCNSNYQIWTDTAGSNETLPINCVDWYQAFAFCAWDGGRLPTEAEWNYAAAGGSEHRYYPWSDPFPSGSTTIDGTYVVYDCIGDGSASGQCALTDILTVGSRPLGDSRWGQADLGGSMYEWNLDWSSESYPMPCDNCANLISASSRVNRGGGWGGDAGFLRAAFRSSSFPDYLSSTVGIRCARTP